MLSNNQLLIFALIAAFTWRWSELKSEVKFQGGTKFQCLQKYK